MGKTTLKREVLSESVGLLLLGDAGACAPGV
jgi:hypothetical protein